MLNGGFTMSLLKEIREHTSSKIIYELSEDHGIIKNGIRYELIAGDKTFTIYNREVIGYARATRKNYLAFYKAYEQRCDGAGLHLSKDMYYRIYRGDVEPKLDKVIRMAETLDIPIEFIVGSFKYIETYADPY